MKKFLRIIIALGFIFCFNIEAFAQYTSNASPVTVILNQSTKRVGITFPFTTRNLTILNNDANDGILVDVKNPNNTQDKSSCYPISAKESLELFDFATDGISIFLDNQFMGGNGVASPISVIATY